MDELADRLAEVANELRWRVRECHPHDVHQWLCERVSGPREWVGLSMILATAVDDMAPFGDLVGWFAPRPDPGFVDEVAVERACSGEKVELNRAEREAVIDRLSRRGVGAKRIGMMLGISERQVTRRRTERRAQVAA